MGTRGRGSEELLEKPAGERGRERGRAQRRRTARRASRRVKRSLVRELPLVGVVALLIALALKTFFVQVFVIPSGSMEQTIQIGDRVLVDKLTPWFGSRPQRGDVVVFKDPGGWLANEPVPSSGGPLGRGIQQAFSYVGLLPSNGEQDLIKRVIGVAGDSVACCDRQGRITVNGTAIDEPYLAAGNPPSRIPFQVKVPPNSLWVMGDHRDVSADSRYHMGNPGGGSVPVKDVVGRAFLIGWPLGRVQQIPAGPAARPVASAAASAAPRDGPGGDPQFAASRPDLLEPSLVMGMLGVPPAIARRRRGKRAGSPRAARRRTARVFRARPPAG
ncbi:signal peptidase I [Kitasatospora sp. MAP12-15]|uniref:signal peptidase I n=1 Tax=unclassified Kitasatospora TaxID=2633591 RepID=UPI0024768B3B|nr:signal peptidase I [Kitasatospora sp. MAP12-44]MDH6113021.1 signal peptidase I [Kitasatospora sp. MAP12-44]